MWGQVFGLAAILTIAVLMLPIADRSKIPYTVILAVLGLGLGFLVETLGVAHVGAGHAPTDAPMWRQAIGAIGSVSITPNVVLYIFLPALLFESSLAADLRKILEDLRPILFLAVIGVIVSIAIIGVVLAPYTGMGLIACLLVGAILSATDPVAVIALFKDLNAPKRLTTLVDGESLLNDATAIVATGILLTIMTTGGEPRVLQGALKFLWVFVGGVAVGVVLARPACWLMGMLKRRPLVILTLTVVLPFLAYPVAENFLHVSGAMAVVAAGLTVSSMGRRYIPPETFAELEHSWGQIAFWATSLIFMLVGISAPQIVGPNPLAYWDEILILAAAATFARFVIIFLMLPLISSNASARVSRAYQAIMMWGGLRGAVSLALALVVMDSPGVTPEVREFIGVLSTGFVLFTLLVQATTMRPFMNMLGLTKMPEADQALRDRSLSSALRSVQKELADVASFNELSKTESEEVISHYRQAIEAAEQSAGEKGISIDEWKRIGLAMALAQERQIYHTRFGEGYLNSRQLSAALARLDDLSDALKEGGGAWTRAVDHGVGFHQAIREAIYLQRRFGIVFLLAEALALRFGVLNVMHGAMREQRESGLAEIEELIPAEARASFRSMYEQRYRSISGALGALALQYPEYAAALRKRNLALTGVRLEEAAYERLRDQAVIGPEIFNVLMRRVTDAEDAAEKLPPLRLRMDPLVLVAKVPFFSNLNKERQRAIAAMLKTRFVAPGEHFIKKGETGEEMYFIASGAVKVLVPTGDISLGTGDFVGELALITRRPRNADVEALAFCTLLALHQRDFKAFLAKNPDLRDIIRDVARERLGDDAETIFTEGALA